MDMIDTIKDNLHNINNVHTQNEAIKWSEWYCYLLVSSDYKRTYIGATNNPDRRLKQHNGELSGGAKATSGHEWRRLVLVAGFPDSKAALQFEWAWKYNSRKLGSGLNNRIKGLKALLEKDKSTSAAIPFKEWMSPPYIIAKNDDLYLLEIVKEWIEL
jgi:predicted GIY-YIG superfamily endonuclease